MVDSADASPLLTDASEHVKPIEGPDGNLLLQIHRGVTPAEILTAVALNYGVLFDGVTFKALSTPLPFYAEIIPDKNPKNCILKPIPHAK